MTRILTTLALSTLLAPAALAQDAGLLAAAQDSMDTDYIVSLEKTWTAMTDLEPGLESLDLSWNEQLDVVEQLADEGVATVDRGSFTLPGIDVEGLLFTELHQTLGGSTLQQFVGQGIVPVRTYGGFEAHYLPETAVELALAAEETSSMVMVMDLESYFPEDYGQDAPALTAVYVDDEYQLLPVDQPMLDYADYVPVDEVSAGPGPFGDEAESGSEEGGEPGGDSGTGPGPFGDEDHSDQDSYAGTETGSSAPQDEPEQESDDNGRDGRSSGTRSGR